MLGPKKTDLKSISDFNSRWADRVALLILVGLAVDIGAVFVSHKAWRDGLTIVADSLIAIGVWGELWFAKRAREADDGRVAEAEKAVAEANERAAKADLARVQLEDQLRPRDVSQKQWDIIQSLRGKMDAISIAYETDFETVRFAIQLRDAFINVGIRAFEYRRAADVHSAGMFVYDPEMQGARLSPNVERIVDLFRGTGPASTRIALAVISGLPTDVPASPEIPALIVGGRFLLPPAYVPPRNSPDDA